MSELLNPCYKQKDARSFCDNTAKFVYTHVQWLEFPFILQPSQATPHRLART